MPVPPRRLGPSLALAILAVLLLAGLGRYYRIDQLRCEGWPPLSSNLVAALTYTGAVAALSLAWLRWLQLTARADGPGLRLVLGWAAVLYLLVGIGLPTLSDDPLFYAVLGRVVREGHSAYQPFCYSLPPDDPWLRLLISHWRCGTSPYLSGFHAIAAGVASVAKQDLAWHLRGYQLVSGLAMLGAALLTALSLRGSALRPAYGAALVALNPLSIIEAPFSAHNDALIALAVAGLVLAYRRGHVGGALLSQVVAVSVKASALLPALFFPAVYALRFAAPIWRRHRGPALNAGLLVAVVGALGLVAALLLHLRPASLFGHSSLPWEYCTRSLECLPRSILRSLLHQPKAATYVAVAFRLLSLLWLAYVAVRAAQSPARLLPWMGTGLLIYYLYLHPWSQSWYLLSLLPLSPWLPPRPGRALRSLTIAATAYYALVFIGNCLQDDLAIAATDLIEGLIVMVPPTVCLLRTPPPTSPPSACEPAGDATRVSAATASTPP